MSEIDDGWEPLPLERDDPALVEAIEKIDAAFEAIRQGNGYAATHPDERNQVVAALESGARILKENTTVPFK